MDSAESALVLPLHDTLQPRRFAWVNTMLIAALFLVFAAQVLAGPERGEALLALLGMSPLRLWYPEEHPWGLAGGLSTLVTSIFLHGGPVHLLGNVVYLAIFGNDVEDRMGPGWYLLFFLGCGVVGSLTHAALFSTSSIPSIGASGAISGLLGAWFVLHPNGRIVALFPLVVWWITAEVPALLFLPLWFALQFVSGFLAIAAAADTQEVAGVAWWAHIGGFAFGLVVALAITAFGSPRDAEES